MKAFWSRWRPAEPTTALTDLVLGAAALYWAYLLGTHARNTASWPGAAMSLALVAAGIGALLGVIIHGYQSRMSERVHGVLWRCALVAPCIANYLLVAAVQRSALPPEWPVVGTVLADLNLGRTLFVAFWVLRWPTYRVVVIDSIFSLVVVMAFLLVVRPVDVVWSLPLGIGVVLALAAGLAQRSGWRRGMPFNHNDLYHILQTAALFYFYSAGLRLFDR